MCIKVWGILCVHADCVSAHTLCRDTRRRNRFPWRWRQPEARELVLLPPPLTPFHAIAPTAPSPRASQEVVPLFLNFSPEISQLFPRYFSTFSQIFFNFSPDISQLFLNISPELSQSPPTFSQLILNLSQTCSNFWYLVSFQGSMESHTLQLWTLQA